MKTESKPDFDLIARPYRTLEYLTLGPALELTRNHFLPQIAHSKNALILGDGDGRFLARLLARNPQLRATAVDSSAAMLHLLRRRCESSISDAALRLKTIQADALQFTPADSYDLIVSHFFLDCFTQSRLETLIPPIASSLAPSGVWVLSDFRIPSNSLAVPARILVRSLYLAFRFLTGLRTSQLADYKAPLTAAGLTCITRHQLLGGVLVTELWQRPLTVNSALVQPTQLV
jgi:ubiquinone/menaquinone biosynthesis C-methylase UbiE